MRDHAIRKLVQLTLLALFSARVLPQVKVGDELNLNLNGQLTGNYASNYGNYTQSNHQINYGGTGDLNGSYYNPNFLSFRINPFYNQSRANSNYQSIFDSSGVDASVNIFSGSHFPGFVSYSKLYTSAGTYHLPGLSDYTTNGNSSSFGIGWAENLPDAPSLSANYQQGGSDYNIYGESTSNTNHFHTFHLNSAYKLSGFMLNAGYTYSKSNSQFPTLFVDRLETSSSNDSSYYAGVGHALPLHGSFSATYNRSNFDSNYTSTAQAEPNTTSGNVDTVSLNTVFGPVPHLSSGASVVYTNNLLGSLYGPLLTSSSVVIEPVGAQRSTHSVDFTEYANFQATPHVTVFGNAQQLSQDYVGGSISTQAYTGTVSYSNTVWRGNATVVGGITANSTSGSLNATPTQVGGIASANYSRNFESWETAGSLYYVQNTQTSVAGFTTSNFGYSAKLAHGLGGVWRWSLIANGSKNLLNRTGYSTFNQTYSGSLSARWLAVTGSYTHLSANALLTGSGLLPTNIPAVLVPTELVFYGGTGWGVGVGATPVRRLTLSATYSKSHSSTESVSIFSSNHNETFVATSQYQVRQLYFLGGYTRLEQGFSASNRPNEILGYWFAGIQRWFNFF